CDDGARAIFAEEGLAAVLSRLAPRRIGFLSETSVDGEVIEIAIDLNYSDLVNFSENEFTKAGPGALRGISKVFEDLGDYSPTVWTLT
ncbi:MAG: nucleotide kinase domain-containing protein, partial [Pseudonocardiaceae bacterium]